MGKIVLYLISMEQAPLLKKVRRTPSARSLPAVALFIALFAVVSLPPSPASCQYGFADLEGRINEVDVEERKIGLLGRWIAVEDSTTIVHEFAWEEQELAAHMQGAKALVWGGQDSLGIYHVRLILLTSFEHLGGPLEEVWGSGFRILGTDFFFAPQFQPYLGHIYKKPIPWSEFHPGDVAVTSWMLEDGLRYTSLIVKMLPGGSVSAPVGSVDPENMLLRVGGVNIRGTEWLLISTWDGQGVEIGDLQPGQWLSTEIGDMYAADSLIVERGTLEKEEKEFWEYGGVIQSVDTLDSTVTMLGIPFQVRWGTLLFDMTMTPLSLADLEVGRGFMCQAEPGPDSAITLLGGFQSYPMSAGLLVKGEIREVDLEAKEMRIGDIDLTFTSSLHISLLGMEGFTVEDLITGLNADVSAVLFPDRVEATSVRLEPSSALGNHKIDYIDELDSLLLVFGQPVKVLPKTVIWEKFGDDDPREIPFSGLSTGDSVYVQGNFAPPDTIAAFIVTVLRNPVSIDNEEPAVPPVPRGPELAQNYPNPLNPVTTIEFSVPSQSGAAGRGSLVRVELDVYDVRGRKVCVLLDSLLPAGEHSVVWNGRDEQGGSVQSGIYFYRLTCDSTRLVRRMMVLR